MRGFMVAIALLLSIGGCANTKFIVCGLDVTNMKGKDFGVAALGAVASLATHIGGHYIAGSIFNVDFEMDGLSERIDYAAGPAGKDIKWFARGGFVLQVGVNTILTSFFEDSYFTRGYTAMTAVELLSYPIRKTDDGDFFLLDQEGGNGNLEYLLYLGITGYNVFRTSKEYRPNQL